MYIPKMISCRFNPRKGRKGLCVMTRSHKSAKLCKHVSLHNAQHNMRRRQIIAFTVAIIVVVILLYIYAASDTEIIRDIISGTVVSIIASLVLYILTEFVFCDNSIKDNINEIKESIIVSEDVNVQSKCNI